MSRLDRRSLIKSVAVFSIIPFLHRKAPAQALTLVPVPVAYVVAGATISSGIAAVVGFFTDRERTRVLKEISRKLDRVLENQELILSEIRALRLYFDEALERSWRNSHARALGAIKERFEILLNEPVLNARVRDQLVRLSDQCLQETLSIGQFDLGAFPFFASGVLINLSIYRLIRISPSVQRATKKKFQAKVDWWLSPTNDRSIVTAITKNTKELNKLRDDVAAAPRVVKKFANRSEGRCTWTIETTVTISGSLETEFTGSQTNREINRECRDAPDHHTDRPGCPRCEAVEEELLASYESRRKFLSGAFLPSDAGIPEVNALNAQRLQILGLIDLLAKQEVIKASMLKVVESLRAATVLTPG